MWKAYSKRKGTLSAIELDEVKFMKFWESIYAYDTQDEAPQPLPSSITIEEIVAVCKKVK